MATPARYRVATPTDRGPAGWARACQSLVVRAPGPVDAAAARRALKAATAQWEAPAGIQLWVEQVPVPAGTAAASERARREASRPLHPGQPLRAVLLRYLDGAQDLVLVARRPAVAGRTLHALAERLLAAEASGSAAALAGKNTPRSQGGTRPEVEWGLGDPARSGRTGEVTAQVPELATSDGEELLLGAVGLVLHRYGAGDGTAVGVLDAGGGGEEISVRRVVVDESERAAGFLARWRGPYGDETLQQGALPPVGVVRAKPGHRPFLAPVLPVIVHADGGGNLRVLFDEGETAPSTARRFASHVAHVAGQLAADPDRTLAEVELMTPDEVTAVLAAGVTPPAGDAAAARRTIHALFAEVVRRQPDAPAVTAGSVELTYAELAAQAGQVAAGLRELGTPPGSLVAVALERDAWLVVTLLGVMMAGCAYVPVDLRYPEERLRHTVQDCGATVAIGDAGTFPQVAGVRVVTPAEVRELGARERDKAGEAEAAEAADDSSTAAYVIYTSGSTGRPKGVVIPHRNVAALVEATREELGLGSRDVWTLFHSSAFDFSVWEIWGCLLTGGRLVVVDYWTTRDTELFHELLVEQGVTVLNQTPSAFAQLVEVDRRSAAEVALRLVIFGGEPLDVRMLAPWFARHSHTRCRMVNMFGITETTVHVTAQTVTPADVVAGSRSVGPALPGWTLSVRDPRGRVLPPGVAGEICVGGAGVANRYLGQPELTAQRFVADPYGGGRIYRSGDRGRLHPDGSLDHLGRLDSQVKVRGHRIELDEIRNVLLSHPAVAGAAVVLNYETPGDGATARLDAYIVLRDALVTTRDVLAHACQVLPAYMVPTSITTVDAIPLTINGKVDVAALPAPVLPRDDEAGGAVVPAAADDPGRDGLSAEILKLWSHVLNTEVPLDGNFFELGGNSLLVIRLLRQMREVGLPKVATRDFYRNSTAAGFIELVRTLAN